MSDYVSVSVSVSVGQGVREGATTLFKALVVQLVAGQGSGCVRV